MGRRGRREALKSPVDRVEKGWNRLEKVGPAVNREQQQKNSNDHYHVIR